MNRKFYYVISSVAVTICFLYVFTYSFGYNVIATNYKATVFFSKIIPQGWGFFAKNPREDLYLNIYSLSDKKILDVMPVASHYTNFGGLSKKTQMISFESSLILSQIDSTAWKPWNGQFSTLESDYVIICDTNLHYLVEGDYAFIRKGVTPYLWRNLKNNKIKKEIVYVRCIKK